LPSHITAGVKSERKIGHDSYSSVGASGLDVSRLLAAVADALSRRRGAVPGDVANLAAVVALLALGAVPGHVTNTAT